MQIRSVDIKPLDDTLVWYWVQFEDTHFADTPKSRLNTIKESAVNILRNTDDVVPKFRSVWQKKETVALKLSRPEIRVEIDNESVNSATIIDVFAYDKPGLLYRLARKIHRLGLNVKFARISTYAHQVIDVFYVTDEEGDKIRNRNQLQIIKKEVFRAVKEFLEPEDENNSST